MSSESPYIGSKISLISKAKIRYEGILYTIDTENATVALAKVRSFGTEDRPCERPVAPRDEIYEYIIFRGTDIEDLTVCEPPKPAAPQPAQSLPQDPAIVQSVVTSQPSVPPNLPPFSATNPYNQIPTTNYSAYIQPRMPYTSLGSAPVAVTTDSKSPLPPVPSDKAASPVSMGRTSPTSEQGVQAGSPAAPLEHQPQRRAYESSNYYNNSSRRNNNYDGQQASSYHNTDSAEGNNRGRGGYRRGYRSRDDDYESRGRGQRRTYYRGHNDGQSQNYRGQRYTRGRRYPSRNDPLRFDGDFDFESSNAQFNKEEIAKELMTKLKISDGQTKEDVKSKSEEKQDSGVDSGTSHEAAEESDEGEDTACYYDKSKSFFDNITCETNNPRGERMSWTEERKKNTETFGSAWRGGRGGYRGRGYGNRGQYRGRGRGGYQQQRDDGERRNYYNHRYNSSYERGDKSQEGGGNRGRGYYYRGYNRSRGQSSDRQWVDYEYRYERRPRYKQDGEKVNT